MAPNSGAKKQPPFKMALNENIISMNRIYRVPSAVYGVLGAISFDSGSLGILCVTKVDTIDSLFQVYKIREVKFIELPCLTKRDMRYSAKIPSVLKAQPLPSRTLHLFQKVRIYFFFKCFSS
jgi:hypothetical protein